MFGCQLIAWHLEACQYEQSTIPYIPNLRTGCVTLPTSADTLCAVDVLEVTCCNYQHVTKSIAANRHRKDGSYYSNENLSSEFIWGRRRTVCSDICWPLSANADRANNLDVDSHCTRYPPLSDGLFSLGTSCWSAANRCSPNVVTWQR